MKAFERILKDQDYPTSFFQVRQPDGALAVVCGADLLVLSQLLHCEVVKESLTWEEVEQLGVRRS